MNTLGIQGGLEQLPGGQTVRLDRQSAVVEYDRSLVAVSDISEIINDLGYEVQ